MSQKNPEKALNVQVQTPSTRCSKKESPIRNFIDPKLSHKRLLRSQSGRKAPVTYSNSDLSDNNIIWVTEGLEHNFKVQRIKKQHKGSKLLSVSKRMSEVMKTAGREIDQLHTSSSKRLDKDIDHFQEYLKQTDYELGTIQDDVKTQEINEDLDTHPSQIEPFRGRLLVQSTKRLR